MDTDNVYNETVLLKKLAAGEEAAFRQLYDLYGGVVYMAALQFLKDAFQAEEAVQEIFLRLWRDRQKLPEVQNLKDYLFIVARNESLNRLKRILLRRQQTSSIPGITPGTTDGPGEYMAERELNALVQKAIGLLPAQQRRAYIYASEEGYSYEEIARRMALSRETVKRHLTISRKFVREFVKKHLDGAAAIPVISVLYGILK